MERRPYRRTIRGSRQSIRELKILQEEIFKSIAEAKKIREEATKKYEEEMAGYLEGDIHTNCCSHDPPPANESTHPLVFSIPVPSSPYRSLLDISTKDFHTIISPHFRDAACLYNKGEWLLMCRQEEILNQSSLFLLNAVSWSRIDLPMPSEKGRFAFSLISGNQPHHVIHASCKSPSGAVVILAIRPGDSSWEVHELDGSHRGIAISHAFVTGELVTCIDHNGGRIITYDLSACCWRVLSGRAKFPNRSKCFFIDRDDDVMCVSCPCRYCDFFRFYKLDRRTDDWVEIRNIDLMNTSWFLGQPCSFCVEGGRGKYVYSLECIYLWGGQPGEGKRPTKSAHYYTYFGENLPVNIYIHDMVEGRIENLLPNPYASKKPPCWVDARVLQ